MKNGLQLCPTRLTEERLGPIPLFNLSSALAEVAALARRHDIAQVMLATLADRNDVFNL
jgi:hypothetical protein